MIKLDNRLIVSALVAMENSLKNDLENQQRILADLLEHGKGCKVIEDSIPEQEKLVTDTKLELRRLQQFLDQFPEGLGWYEFYAEKCKP